MRVLVVVPCRDEARVIARKVANLARCAWPASDRAHEVVLVDDGSRDATRELAAAAAEREFTDRADVRPRVAVNTGRPGKPGAVRTGIREADAFDLVVLTDADVVVEPDALVALCAAFERDPRLALACGAQRFVADLADHGSCRARNGGPPADAPGTYDRWTALVRRLESRAGILFSVHGQLCAWRAELGLAPGLGLAADDLDLRFQVKARASEPRRVELVPGAVFLEVKAPAGREREAQAERRARAWFQALRGRRIPARGALERIQALLYRVGPRAAPLATWCSVPALSVVALCAGGAAPAAVVLLGGTAVLLSPPGRRWLDLSRTIERAARAERRESAPERWETPRP